MWFMCDEYHGARWLLGRCENLVMVQGHRICLLSFLASRSSIDMGSCSSLPLSSQFRQSLFIISQTLVAIITSIRLQYASRTLSTPFPRQCLDRKCSCTNRLFLPLCLILNHHRDHTLDGDCDCCSTLAIGCEFGYYW